VNTADIRALFGYDRWANFRLLDAASQLSTAEFTRDLGASFGSIRGTLVHIMWGERRWLQYWQEGTFAPPPNADDFPDAGAIAVAWSKLECQLCLEVGIALFSRSSGRRQSFVIWLLRLPVSRHSSA
jgi:uncharacterized damage-inducible protein DinB